MAGMEKTLDDWYGKIQKQLTGKISNFVAFLFFLFALGALIMLMVMQKYPQQAFLVILGPAVAGIIAYYNRIFATIVFFGVVILIFFF